MSDTVSAVLGVLLMMPVAIMGALSVSNAMRDQAQGLSDYVRSNVPPAPDQTDCVTQDFISGAGATVSHVRFCRSMPNATSPNPGCALDSLGWEWCRA